MRIKMLHFGENLKNEIEKTNKLFIKTVSKVGNILEKNMLLVISI